MLIIPSSWDSQLGGYLPASVGVLLCASCCGALPSAGHRLHSAAVPVGPDRRDPAVARVARHGRYGP
jgi:hypothetical protein